MVKVVIHKLISTDFLFLWSQQHLKAWSRDQALIGKLDGFKPSKAMAKNRNLAFNRKVNNKYLLQSTLEN